MLRFFSAWYEAISVVVIVNLRQIPGLVPSFGYILRGGSQYGEALCHFFLAKHRYNYHYKSITETLVAGTLCSLDYFFCTRCIWVS